MLKILEKYLPKEFVHRPKKGFSFNYKLFFNNEIKDDFIKALDFHRNNLDQFGLDIKIKGLFNSRNADLLIGKYPRFVYSLISNYKVFNK